MAKYDPLKERLRDSRSQEVQMSFGSISNLVGGLPPSAKRYREWWANDTTGSHVQARAWSGAGFEVASIDLARESVVFRRR
jgi:hypothetical protein